MQRSADQSLSNPARDSAMGDPSMLVGLMLSSILRRWRLILLVSVTMILVVYVMLQVISDVYTSHATLLVKVGRENVEVPGVLAGGSIVSTGVRKEDINSEVSLLGSRALIERTVDVIGLDAFQPKPAVPVTLFQKVRRAFSTTVQEVLRRTEDLLVALNLVRQQSFREKIIDRIENRLMVRREGESDVIAVSLGFPDPDLSARFIATHIEQFMTRRLTARRSDGISQFFNDRVSMGRARLDQLDTDILQLRSKLSLASVEQERSNLLRRLAELDASIAAVASASAVADALSGFMPAASDAAQSGAGATPTAVRARISELIIERALLLQRFAPNAEPVRELDGRIGQLTALLDRSAAKELSTLTVERAGIEKRLEILNSGELELDRLMLDRSLARERYGEYIKQRDAALVGAELEQRRVANISVLTPPTHPSLPDSPRRLMIMLITLPLSLLLGIAMAALFAFLDPRVFTQYDLARVAGTSALGTFRPDVNHRVKRQDRLRSS